MLWDIQNKESCIIYINKVLDLKVKICEKNGKDEVYMNHRRVHSPMLASLQTFP